VKYNNQKVIVQHSFITKFSNIYGKVSISLKIPLIIIFINLLPTLALG